jgi:hypothetical protein
LIGIQEIQKLKKEVVLETCGLVLENPGARLYVETLINLMSTAKPLNGNGYFQVWLFICQMWRPQSQ